MSTLNQYIAVKSLDQSLVPSPYLIDGRTEQDWLSFMAEFASLINFYDSDNNINGNWAPFLLKDPVLLLASIAKTNVTKIHSLYLQTSAKLEEALTTTLRSQNITNSFIQLFDQLLRLFLCIERWIHFMLKSSQAYSLKQYAIYQAENTYSALLWAIVALRKQMHLQHTVAGVGEYDITVFDKSDEKIWKQNKDKKPYWEILQLKSTWVNNSLLDIYNALKNAGDQLFTFFNTIVQQANIAYEQLKIERGKFPDTILIRTFINLLMIHRNQLNGITQKHLDFYYTDILKQKIQTALPDSVYIAIELSKKDMPYFLPLSTLFDAGMNAQKLPVVFASQENVSLNPAAIVAAHTLTALDVTGTPTSLYLQSIPTPDAILTDEEGNILSWPAFGGNPPPASTTTKLALAIASPLFLLREGTRTIQMAFTFNNSDALAFLQTANFYLSTQTAWLPVTGTVGIVTGNPAVILEINLDNTQAPIEAFLKNPDGYTCNWPLLKIEFDTFTTYKAPPAITALSVQVTITNIAGLQLYNDYGALSTKAAYPPLGPTPNINNNFIIGSDEIFSKPLQSLYISMNWDVLPANFQTYYQPYNNYLNPFLLLASELASVPTPTPAATPATKPPSFLKKVGTGIKKGVGKAFTFVKNAVVGVAKVSYKVVKGIISIPIGWLTKLIKWILKALKIIVDIAAVAESSMPFNNVCFTVDFNVLQNHSWTTFGMKKQGAIVITGNTIVPSPYTIDPSCIPNATPDANLLFSTQNNVITPYSYFANGAKYAPTVTPTNTTDVTATVAPAPVTVPTTPTPPSPDPIIFNADPTIQITPLKYTDTSSSGFMKMTLTGPDNYGFGATVYPDVVASVALKNAKGILATPPVEPIAPPKIPFTPKLLSLTAHYTAYQQYDFTQQGANPVQCYAYTPFSNYLAYNNAISMPAYNYNVGDNNIPEAILQTTSNTTPEATQQEKNGVPLFSSLNGNKGFLFLELTNVIAPNELNLYFELARKYGNTSASKATITCYYLSTNGWQLLSKLADGTNNLSCSGILKLNIPADITNKSTLMSSNNYWLCIATNNAPEIYAQITFLKTNGVKLLRAGTEYLEDETIPKIMSNVISKPHTALPAIAKVMQPFSSFGGKAMETQLLKNYRVSNRLKTKDRAVSAEDYYRLIQQQFNDIFYSKTIYNNVTKTTQVYVVKGYDSYTDANAFTPLISECKEEQIQNHLQSKASAFTQINVSNFDFLYVTISATIIVSDGYELQGVQKKIQQALNIYLSPWITSNTTQITIDEPINDIQVAEFIRSIPGVASVDSVYFYTSTSNEALPSNTIKTIGRTTISAASSYLIASSRNHFIQQAPPLK